MRLLFFGDIVGRHAREALIAEVPRLRRALGADFVVANGENAAHGFGITDTICAELYAGGVDVITTGNHIWDRREIMAYIAGDPRLLRPVNFPHGTPGNGFGVYALREGRSVLVVNAMARLFMDALDDPFAAVERVLGLHPLGQVSAILVDFHGEASSEKTSMGHFCDGRVSAVLGTHCHVPTADHRILGGGTAYMTDVGMCGDYDSVIGMQKEAAVARFVRKLPGERLEVSPGEPTLCGVLVETDDETGLARAIWPLRLGGKLDPAFPQAALVDVAAPAK
jgi:2',3'-cyclic-nucleotide 2'-phosphodiesterase